MTFFDYLVTAFALVFVIEGMMYAVFPATMQRILLVALAMPVQSMRRFGVVMAGLGFVLAWLGGL